MSSGPSSLKEYDKLPPSEALVKIWEDHGPNLAWHLMAKEDVRATMPHLARALDRLVEENASKQTGNRS